MNLKEKVLELFELPANELPRKETLDLLEQVLNGLNGGTLRAASQNESGEWVSHPWVKKAILIGFRIGSIVKQGEGLFPFYDKDTYPLKPMTGDMGVRIVPGGSSIRTGSYVAPGVVCMPPMYINVGAYIDEGTMVDSHALVGSCAQIGRRVHLSAAVQIGGVLEPPGALPVIVEDHAFIGGGCGLYEGCLIGEGAVLAPGVTLTGSTRVYDLVNETTYTREKDAPLRIPPGAVVVQGSRPATGAFAQAKGLQLYAPVIVKYRDDTTNASTALEEALR